MMLLWRNAFPRTPRELESEKARGDAFTWKISLEARAGAMAAIHSLLQNAALAQSSISVATGNKPWIVYQFSFIPFRIKTRRQQFLIDINNL